MSESWPMIHLGQLVEGGALPYGIVQPGRHEPGGVPIVRVKDLQRGQILTRAPMRVEPSVSERHSRTVLRGGELLVSIVGTVGESAIVPREFAGWNVARAIAVLRPCGASAEWIRLALQTREVRTALESVLNTTVQATLNLADLKRLPIPMPPEVVRRSTAEVLGVLDEKIAANNTVARRAWELGWQLYLSRRSVGALKVRLGDTATVVLGGTPSRSVARYWEGGSIAWIASGKANEERILEPSALVTAEALESSSAKMMPPGATVLAITGATLGQIARLEIWACGNQSLVGIWHEDAARNDWLYYAVQEQLPELLRKATGAAQQHVNKQDVEALEIPKPPVADLASWGATVRPLLDVAARVDAESKRLVSTRDELLALLMSGRVQVREAERAVGGVL